MRFASAWWLGLFLPRRPRFAPPPSVRRIPPSPPSPRSTPFAPRRRNYAAYLPSYVERIEEAYVRPVKPERPL